MSEAQSDGYEIPLHTSITEPILMAGVPRGFAIACWTLVAAIGIPLGLFYISVPLGMIAHGIAAWFTRRDPIFFESLRRHLKQASHYD